MWIPSSIVIVDLYFVACFTFYVLSISIDAKTERKTEESDEEKKPFVFLLEILNSVKILSYNQSSIQSQKINLLVDDNNLQLNNNI